MERTRNFCIIAHIDHGKSTLADRMLEVTKTVESRDMKDQMLDQMDLERERGITIKLQPVRMQHTVDGTDYIINLIDTPGHVDFSYEVSRSLAAVEGAVLLVDASQGVQAQTLTTLYQAIEQDLTIIPVINKIDLPHAEPERRAEELMNLIGCKREDILFASGKTGMGVKEILDTVVAQVPAPQGNPNAPLRALVFDCTFDPYRGVVAYLRVVDGSLDDRQLAHLIQGNTDTETLEVGYFFPKRLEQPNLKCGDIGYIITGLKEVSEIGIGETVTISGRNTIGSAGPKDAPEALPGYRVVTPMVFASLYPTDSDDYGKLRDSIAKYKLNDSALSYVAEHSPALGFGFRCGFLGMLHLEIVTERLSREFGSETITTVPSVAYEIVGTNGKVTEVHSPAELPDPTFYSEIREPWVKLEVVSPQSYMGNIMELSSKHRGTYLGTHYLDADRVVLSYEIPLVEIVVTYYDELKSVSSGYASMSYEILGFRAGKLTKLDLMVGGDVVDPLATIVPTDQAEIHGRRLCERLKDLIPRQNFDIAIQAAISGRIVARETIKAYRKDVTGYLYGGDVTRKMKLLNKQKEGKKRMKKFGKVEIPGNVFVDLLKR
ncbi:MAG TPA: translation elongation factor 4 [Verrucomicrobiae bacterium]|nr:translation elongation factor 4 [Verrucomicrobiae bacterium]